MMVWVDLNLGKCHFTSCASDNKTMNVIWNDIDPSTWDQHHALHAGALQQDWAYGSTMKLLGVPVLRACVYRDGVIVAQAQFIVRRWGPLASVALCSRGPIWLQDLSPSDHTAVYKLLKQTLPLQGLRFLLVTPEHPQNEAVGLPFWRRVMTPYSTVMLDLSQDTAALRLGLEAKWRNRLVAAENSALQVQRTGVKFSQYRWLLDHEQQQRQSRGLAGLPMPFFEPYAQSRKNKGPTIFGVRADVQRERVAGMLFLIHGEAATYQIGWSSPQGRDLNAHNLLLWDAMQGLKDKGVRRLDLGGVNTQRSAGIARFKIGSGGQVLSLAGTYLL